MIYDQKRIRELKELGGEEFVAQLWRTFIDICSVEIPKLEDALMTEKGDVAAFVAHALRSASGNVGASLLHEVCTMIEDQAKARNANFADLAATLISTYEETLACEPARKIA